MKVRLLILFSLHFVSSTRDFYVGMFKKDDLLVATDTLYQDRIPYRTTRGMYGRLFKCNITYFRVVDRLGVGRVPKVEITRGGLRKKYLVLRITSGYNLPLSVNIYVGCENKYNVTRSTYIVRRTTPTVAGKGLTKTKKKRNGTPTTTTTAKPKEEEKIDETKDEKESEKKDGEEGEKKDGEEGEKKDGEEGEKKDGEEGEKKDGEEGEKKDGDEGEKKDGEEGEKKDGEEGEKKDGEEGEKKDGEEGEKKDDDGGD